MFDLPANEVQGTESTESLPQQRSRIIGKVLSPAVKLWLRSQVEQVADLQLHIAGGDRQILSGYIPKVTLFTSRAVYQGLHLQQIGLIAENIRVNLGQVIKGKPLRLLEPIRAQGELFLSEDDLNASLNSELLISGLNEFFQLLLKAAGTNSPAFRNHQIHWQKITVDGNQIHLQGSLLDTKNPIIITTGVRITDGNQLHLDNPQFQGNLGLNSPNLDSLTIDLGTDVDIQELTLSNGQLICRGSISVTSD
ncbi:DUF2993 domain-containing protein [Phormidium sp. LEGE 05292]|uniref:LmeA family phospholipid-binding protein n=1 Tax=[Phormidium] sp. LEGE 05292 TaxID=767427 RepID=UPI00187FCA01|nr:DUF2993 domain-containing protein [Phormidium sp. LEGE 05292]MBE9228514.1 DUF2993 domain-containing protein [Phormidium sp. LEGE 05292]